METQILTAIAGGLGGAFKAFFGWMKSGTPFRVKLFVTSLVEGAIGGVIVGYAVPSIPLAFFGGMGINEMADFNNFWGEFRKTNAKRK